MDGANDEPLGLPSHKVKHSNTRLAQNGGTTSSCKIEPSVTADRSIMDAIVYERLKATQVSIRFIFLSSSGIGVRLLPSPDYASQEL